MCYQEGNYSYLLSGYKVSRKEQKGGRKGEEERDTLLNLFKGVTILHTITPDSLDIF